MNKFKNEFLKDKKYILFSLFMIIFNILFLNYTFIMNDKDLAGKKYIALLIGSIILEIGILWAFKSSYKKEPLEKTFLKLIIPIGIIYTLIIPVGLSPDERNHFLRAYEITEGDLITPNKKNGTLKPVSVDKMFTFAKGHNYQNIRKNVFKKNNHVNKKYTYFNTALYNFVCYIPQSIGIFIGRFLDLPILVIAYLGRIFNFLVAVLMIYLAIKIIPSYKKVIFAISMLPMSLEELTSLAPDALTISSIILLLACVLYLKYNVKTQMSKKQEILILLLTILVSLCKIVYLPICLLLILIPKERFKSKKVKLIKIGIAAAIVVVINLIWLKIASRYLIEFQEGVNTSKQVKFILSNPFNYIQVIFNTIFANFDFYLFTAFGSRLEALDVYVPTIYIITSIGLFNVLIFMDSHTTRKLEKWEKYLIAFIIFATVILIFTSLYVQWTKVGSKIIMGLQGRYFLPLAVLLPVLFNTNTKNANVTKNEDNFFEYYSAFSIFEAFCSILILIFVSL